MEVRIGDELQKDTKIYRYMSIKEFMYFVEFNTINLTRVTNWEDPWEDPMRKIPAQSELGSIAFPICSEKSDMFGQCWTRKKESDAMWRIYSANKDGIKIGTTMEKIKLLEGARWCCVGNVFYYKKLIEATEYCENHDKNITPHFRLCLIKRDAFTHEDEVRILVGNAPNILDKTLDYNEDYLALKVNANEFIEEIELDSRSEQYYLDTIRSYCKKSGITAIPKKSKLYDNDIYDESQVVKVFRAIKKNV